MDGLGGTMLSAMNQEHLRKLIMGGSGIDSQLQVSE
jgi:hypothetical protein